MELIEAKALVNVRPEFDAAGNPGSIVRAGNMVKLQVHELEKYVDIGAVEQPKYKYVSPEDPSEALKVPDPGGLAFPKTEGGDA